MRSDIFKQAIQFVALTLFVILVSACAKPIDRNVLGNNFGGNTDPGNIGAPGPVLPEFTSFQPTSTATATETQLENNNIWATGSASNGGTPSVAPSYIPLGNILPAGYFTGSNHGFALDVLIGRMDIINGRLISYPSGYTNNMSMASLSYSFPDVYMGGQTDARGPSGTEAALFGRYHDIVRDNIGGTTIHCNAKCVLTSDGRAEIRSQWGTNNPITLSSRQVPAAHGIVECAMFQDNIAMYFNGVLVGLVEDVVLSSANTQSAVHESFFGFQGNGSSWGDFTVVDLQKVRNEHRIVHYRDEFNRPSSPDLGPQWRDLDGDIHVINQRITPVVPNYDSVSVLTPVDVNNVDVRAAYRLIPVGSFAEAGIVFGLYDGTDRAHDRYSARVTYRSGQYFAGLYRHGVLIGNEKVLPLHLNHQAGDIRVVVRDQYAQVYVNNQLRLAKRLPSYPKGAVGVRLHSAEMDDFSVGYP